MQTLAYWQQRAAELALEGRALINGQLVNAASGKTFSCISPIDGRELAQIVECGAPEVDAAVAAAREAFEHSGWALVNPRQRKQMLLRFADLITQHREELALLESLDTGKPISDSLAVDIPGAAYAVAWYAEAIDKLGGEVPPLDRHLLGMVTREPIGVVACVVPWNFPLLMASWKFAPALAAGNAIVLKPSEKSPLTAIRVGQLALQAGIPPGVFNVLPGGGEVGKLLALHNDVDCIAFTGSTAVGKLITQYAGQSNLKRVWLELGGKSPHIILADCPDLDRAAATAAGGIFYNAGQMCSAGSRLLVQDSIRDVFLEKLLAKVQQWVPAHPLDPQTSLGAIVDEVQLARVQSYIASGKAEASLLTGGERALQESGGYYLQPTVFACEPQHRIAREEIFGPVLSVLGFATLDEAIQLANASEYGLAAAVWTSDLATAHDAARRLRAGTVWVNGYEEGGDMNLPFGGYRQSGNGRDKSLHALEKYTELKSTLIRLR